jgi:hypothetical protein
LDIGFLDHRDERFLRRSARLEERREIAAATQLGNLQLDRAGTRLPAPIAIPIARNLALTTALAVAGAAAAFDVEIHEPLGDEGEHLAQHVGVGPLFGELGKCHTEVGGHRGPFG